MAGMNRVSLSKMEVEARRNRIMARLPDTLHEHLGVHRAVRALIRLQAMGSRELWNLV